MHFKCATHTHTHTHFICFAVSKKQIFIPLNKLLVRYCYTEIKDRFRVIILFLKVFHSLTNLLRFQVFFMNLRKISTEFNMEMEDPVKMKPFDERSKVFPDQCKNDEKNWFCYGLKMNKFQ